MDFAALGFGLRQFGGGVIRVCKRVLAGLVTLVCAAALQAAPQDEHKRALLAFQRGDVGGAMMALRAPAKAGYAPSQALLAFLLERIDLNTEAAALWRDAAAQGDVDGLAGLANMYLTGRGVAKDEKLALQHFSEAAARGHAASIDVVATAWLSGAMGADAAADPTTARAAVLRAAEQGHLPSADALVLAHRNGRFGLAVDEAQALAWQKRAAEWRKQRAAAPAKAAP